MRNWKSVVSAAACAALATAGLARAGDTSEMRLGDGASLTQPLMLQEAPATAPATTEAAPPAKKPLMALLDTTPIGKALEAANINIYGFVEGGYTYSGSAPPGNIITGNVFNVKHERIVLDQLDLTIERTVDPAAVAKAHTFDVGGRVEWIYGFDAGIIHSDGLFDYYNSRFSPENQFDLNQAYVDIALPIGNGLLVRVGKFVTLLGYEVINPTGNPLYSHSYLFGYAIPFTQTGVLATYALNDQWTVEGGVTRGWNQSLRDNNGAVDFLGEVTYAPNAATKFILNVSEGPQAFHDNGDYWTVIDFQYVQKIGEKATVALNVDYGDAPHAAGSGAAQWYGAALYGQYVLNDFLTLNARGEVYDDNNGATLGGPGNLQVYEATFGVTITPVPGNDILKNFTIRPEVRIDYASKAFYDGFTDRYQFQAAIDAIFVF